MLVSFADKDENINTAFPTADWNLDFTEQTETTKVSIAMKYETLADLEKMIEMGAFFEEGFRMFLENLDNYFAAHIQS
jgi:PhnB protein